VLNFIRKDRLPLLVKIILCTGIPFILTVCLLFAIHFRQGAESSLTWPFVLKNAAYLLGIALILHRACLRSLFKLVQLPIRSMIAGSGRLGLKARVTGDRRTRMMNWGNWPKAIHQVGEKVRAKHAALTEQREIYWRLFEAAPCIITVQNKDFELIRYNKYV